MECFVPSQPVIHKEVAHHGLRQVEGDVTYAGAVEGGLVTGQVLSIVTVCVLYVPFLYLGAGVRVSLL